METYVTKDNNLIIEIKVEEPQTVSVRDGDIDVKVYNENTPKKYKKINGKPLSVEVDKTLLKERHVIKIKTFFIVDSNQLPNKEEIAKNTIINYDFVENDGNSKEFKTTYQDNQDEYMLGKPDRETFSITKRIKVYFLPDIGATTAMINKLNS